LRRWINWGGVDVAVLVDLVAAAVVFVLAVRRNRRPALTLGLTCVAAVVGYVLVSVPDVIEQIPFEGW
jgi:hypothetical protein